MVITPVSFCYEIVTIGCPRITPKTADGVGTGDLDSMLRQVRIRVMVRKFVDIVLEL